MSDGPQAICSTSGLKLWARINSAGCVMGISNNDPRRFPDPTGEPYPSGDRELPLYGDIPEHDIVTESLSAPDYQIKADRVLRKYSVRAKTAAELLAEVSWWYAAVHTNQGRTRDSVDLAGGI